MFCEIGGTVLSQSALDFEGQHFDPLGCYIEILYIFFRTCVQLLPPLTLNIVCSLCFDLSCFFDSSHHFPFDLAIFAKHDVG